MSGPITTTDAAPTPALDSPAACDLEVLEGRATRVGDFDVRRVLPQRPRRTVSAWCFADQMGPGQVSDTHGLDIGPHPHMGLQTVTWLLRGVMLHRDSLGSEQEVRPGQLNLMTAGRGVSHSEETTGIHRGELHGIQLWVAQPEGTRDGNAAFEHHDRLPLAELDNGVATVLIGAFLGVRSTARRDTEHVGIDLDLRPGRTVVPLEPECEYALITTEGAVAIGPCPMEPGRLGYLGVGRQEVPIDASAPARCLLLGGAPFPEPVLMWWNYVARTRQEITSAHRSWTAGEERFGTFASTLPRMEAAGPPWAGPVT